MRLLALETSAKAASVALLCDGVLMAEYYQNSGQTHSRTVMKMAQDLLENCGLTAEQIDAVAYANGPGSFTGIRIGAAAAKGFCWGGELPCAPVSTLESMAWQLGPRDGVICCCMDARRAQVYNALFRYAGEAPERLCPDRAISLEELAKELERFGEPILLVGDGAQLCFDTLHTRLPALRLSPEHLRQQRAGGVALAGWKCWQDGALVSARGPAPQYLRLSQAERERQERLGLTTNK